MNGDFMAVKPSAGDVFFIPLNDHLGVGGQVISIREEEELYIAVMGELIEKNINDIGIIIDQEPILLTLTFDAKIYNEDWPILGNYIENLKFYPDLAFKIKHTGIMSVQSRDKTFIRPAKADELDELEYRSIASPQIIEDIIRSYLYNSDWNEDYEKRLAKYAYRSSRLINLIS
ncbi:hypothetical protein [uncultured Parasphingopyxis sp.]|uniref:hypothetical protein n=1 Tax=uncultured Parasphingopyxis sp. TaxID=1547918 RepID=UPI00263A2A6C|nr:hypothetical protein [uncultured Parasphingopyxis sp.]